MYHGDSLFPKKNVSLLAFPYVNLEIKINKEKYRANTTIIDTEDNIATKKRNT